MTFSGSWLWANGLDRNGSGARSMSVGGASVADTQDAVSALALNPASLGFQKGSELSVTLGAVTGAGEYQNKYGDRGRLQEQRHYFPEVVWRKALTNGVVIGFSAIPDSSREADWFFRDPEGGVDGATSYGWQHHKSKIRNVRAAVGLGMRLSDQFSVGASIGGVYTQNQLASPYIFQSHPALAGMKTLLDLETEGYGVNADLGLTWKPSDTVTMGLSYRTPTQFDTEGEAQGDIGAQLRSLGLAGVPAEYRYDAEIETKLPQKVAWGLSWQAQKRVRLAAQVDWVNWSRALDQLDVHLSNGSNAAINGLLGSDRISDTIPLNWEDRFVYRTGVEFELSQEWALRAGYVYGKSPVPDSTLLPMTAAITEHTVAAGIGYEGQFFRVDLAYQYDLNAAQQAGSSGITGTEYDDSEINISAHWLALTVGFNF